MGQRGTHTTPIISVASRAGSESSSYALSGTGALNCNSEYVTAGSFTQSGQSTNATSDLTIGNRGVALYVLNGGSLSSNTESVGVTSDGTLTQNAGNNTANVIYLGDTGHTGTYTLTGGTFSAPIQHIGNGGIANVTQSGGTNNCFGKDNNSLTIAAGSTYTLNGSGIFPTYYEALQGAFVQDGGTHIVGDSSSFQSGFNIRGVSKTASYVLKNGIFSVSLFGTSDNSTFLQIGGVASTSDQFTLVSTSKYVLQGGSLSSPMEVIGAGGTASTFAQSGGTNTAASMTVGRVLSSLIPQLNGTGTYTLSGGTLAGVFIGALVTARRPRSRSRTNL